MNFGGFGVYFGPTKMHSSRIFEKHRVLGLYCNEIPGIVRFVGPLKANLFSCAVGNVFHTYDCTNLRLMAVSDAHPGPIGCLAADEQLVYTGCGNEIRSHHNSRHVSMDLAKRNFLFFVIP